MTLFPTFASPVVTVQTTPPPVQYEESYVWDFERGDFAYDGAGRNLIADGYHAWVQWCVKAVLTERLSSPILERDYGVEMTQAMGSHRAIAQEVIARTIREALMYDPRTGAVEGFSFSWEGDQAFVEFDVRPTVGTTARVSVAIGPF